MDDDPCHVDGYVVDMISDDETFLVASILDNDKSQGKVLYIPLKQKKQDYIHK